MCAVNITKIIVYQLNIYYKNLKIYILYDQKLEKNSYIVDINDSNNREDFKKFVNFSGNFYAELDKTDEKDMDYI
jgi:hypothetical protein